MQHDSMLGQKVHEHLVKLGKESPVDFLGAKNSEAKIQEHFHGILTHLGMNMSDDSIRETPHRVAKMYCQEIFSGLDYNSFPKCTVVENKMRYDEVVMSRDIAVRSVCEHHFQPIIGQAYVGYLPDKKVLGLSKLNRVVDFFSRRPQVQERLTEQIYYALSFILDTPDIAVVVVADHYCVKLRGVQDDSDTVTSRMGGRFMSVPALRQEFLQLMKT
jgi:GTP cyclohydrolase I